MTGSHRNEWAAPVKPPDALFVVLLPVAYRRCVLLVCLRMINPICIRRWMPRALDSDQVAVLHRYCFSNEMSSVTPKLVVFSMNIEGQEGISDTMGDEAGA